MHEAGSPKSLRGWDAFGDFVEHVLRAIFHVFGEIATALLEFFIFAIL